MAKKGDYTLNITSLWYCFVQQTVFYLFKYFLKQSLTENHINN